VMRRAVERGEISANADVDAGGEVLGCLAAYRAGVQREALGVGFKKLVRVYFFCSVAFVVLELF
ncbi:hypothetical protein, partial [Pseudomonas syringae group genomosp. 7]